MQPAHPCELVHLLEDEGQYLFLCGKRADVKARNYGIWTFAHARWSFRPELLCPECVRLADEQGLSIVYSCLLCGVPHEEPEPTPTDPGGG